MKSQQLTCVRGVAWCAGLVVCLTVGGCGSGSKTDTTKTSTTKSAQNASMRVPRVPNAATATQPPQGAKTLRSLRVVTKSGRQPGKQIGGITGLPTDRALAALGNDVGVFWQNVFNRARVRFRPATQNIIVTSIDTACGSVSTDSDPIYCGRDNTLNWTVGWFDKNAAPLGSFPIGFVVAATWGYQIEAQLGLDRKLNDGQQARMAACLAGLWAADVFRRGALEKNDIRQGARFLVSLSNNRQTVQAIAGAFGKGFNSGRGGACL